MKSILMRTFLFATLVLILGAPLAHAVDGPKNEAELAQAERGEGGEGDGNNDIRMLYEASKRYHDVKSKNPNSPLLRKPRPVEKELGDGAKFMGVDVGPLHSTVMSLAKQVIARVAKDMDETIKNKPQPGSDKYNEHLSAFEKHMDFLEAQITAVAKLSQTYSTPFFVQRDPTKPASQDNIIRGELQMMFADTDQVRLESPKHLRYRLTQLRDHAMTASGQYVIFSIAQSLLALSQLGTNFEGNPISMGDLIKSQTDPVALASWAVFYAAQIKVGQMAQALQRGQIPTQNSGLVGMAAGFVASSMFTEFMGDPDVKQCFKARMSAVRHNNPIVDPESCERAFTTWSVHGKIIQYAPVVASMYLNARFITPTLNAAIKGTGSKVWDGASKSYKLVFRGAELMPNFGKWAAKAIQLTATGLSFTPAGIAAETLNFVVFMKVAELLEPVISGNWNNLNTSTFNIKSWVDKMGLHREFMLPKDLGRPIQNPLEVEATSVRNAQFYMKTIFEQMEKTDWAKPVDVKQCTAGKPMYEVSPALKGDQDLVKRADAKADSIAPETQASENMHDKAFWMKQSQYFTTRMAGRALDVIATVPNLFNQTARQTVRLSVTPSRVGLGAAQWVTGIANRKNDKELRCEVIANLNYGLDDPENKYSVIERYSSINHEWRVFLMKDFQAAYGKWEGLITGFLDQSRSAAKVAEYIATAKFKEKYTHRRPDLSREAINKIINSADKYSMHGAEAMDMIERDNKWADEQAVRDARETAYENPIPGANPDAVLAMAEKLAHQAAAQATNPQMPTSESPERLGFVPTPTMADYVIAGLACGAQVGKGAKPTDIPGILMDLWQKTFKANEYMKTPFGSSLQFVPPNITTDNNDGICAIANPMYYSSGGQDYTVPALIAVHDAIGAHFRKVDPTLDVFAGEWKDAQGRTVHNLANYVYDHIRPEIYESPFDKTGFPKDWKDDDKAKGYKTGFPSFWTDEVKSKTDPLWGYYQGLFEKFVQKKFVPKLFERTMQEGCENPIHALNGGHKASAPPPPRPFDDVGFVNMTATSQKYGSPIVGADYQCQDSAASLRVANGLLKSIEVEVRQYVRGLYEIYVSTHPPETRTKAKAEFLPLANRLIQDFDTTKSPVEGSDEATKDFNEITKLFSKASKAGEMSKKMVDVDFKIRMIKAFDKLSARAITEWQAYGDLYKRLDQQDANSGPTGKFLDNGSSSTGFNHFNGK
jgi:hypothetical protein